MSKSEKKTNKKKIAKDKDALSYKKRMTEWLRPDVRWFPKQIIMKKYAELNGWDWWKRRVLVRKRISNREWIESEVKRMSTKGIKTKILTTKIVKGGELKDCIALFMK